MPRKRFYWKLRESELQLGERTLIMGVLNVTPDSFSDGGRYNDPERALARALELEEQGADIIDIGAESTKPGSRRISADEEWQRLVPVLKQLKGKLQVPLSIDTYKAEIAQRALEYGIDIINDPSGLTFDPEIAKVAANGNAALILNHMRGEPDSWARLPPMPNAPLTISRELEATANRARHAGVERARIVLDPGLGFGKRKEQNAEIIAHLEQLGALEYPILLGPSRKSFLAKGSDSETLFATAAAVAAAVLNGVHIVRVHDVKEMRAVVEVAEQIAAAKAAAFVEKEKEERPQRRGFSGPTFEPERARPTRPPLVKREEPKPAREEVRPAAAPAQFKRDGSLPPRRPFKPREDREGALPPRRSFKPREDREGGRPPRREDRFDKPAFKREGRFEKPAFKREGRFEKPGFKKEGFRRDDSRKSGPPRDRGFKSTGPKRPFDRDRPRSDDRPPRKDFKPDFKPPGKRPFRKRP